MKRHLKKLFVATLCALLLLTALPVGALASGPDSPPVPESFPNIYSVVFLPGSHGVLDLSGPPLMQWVVKGGSATAPDVIAFPHFAFIGWDKDFSCVNGPMIVTALYAPVYTVRFDPGEHGAFDPAGAAAVQPVVKGGSATAPTVIPDGGFRFTGWDSDFTNITGCKTITALYEPVYTVTFDPGEHGAFDPAGANAVQQVSTGGSATAPTVIPDEGFKFIGWDSDFTNITASKTVTALYEPIYTVTFDPGEHGAFDPAGAAAVQPVAPGGSATAPTVIPDEGFEFTGWDSGFTNITASKTVTALYEPITYTVTFQPNNGTATWSSEVAYHATIVRPEDPKYCGYTFAGWYADKELTQAWNFDTGIATADMTLYAKWAPIVITGLPSTYTMYTGGRVTWDPSPSGGTWIFDDTYFSRSGNTFTALKVGEVTVTYSVQCVKHTVKVTILQSELPQTGQPIDTAWLLSGMSGVPLLAGFLVSRKKK